MRRSSVVVALTIGLLAVASPASAHPKVCHGPRPEMGMTGNALYDEACKRSALHGPWKRHSKWL